MPFLSLHSPLVWQQLAWGQYASTVQAGRHLLQCFLSLGSMSQAWHWNRFAENQPSWTIIVLPTCLNALPIYIIKTFLVTSCPYFQVGRRFIRSLGRAFHPLSQGKVAFWILSGHKTTEGITHLLVLLETLYVARLNTLQEIPLILVFLPCLMQPRNNISRTFLLFVEKSGLIAQHPPCLISTLQSRPILGITWFLGWMWKKTRSSILLWNIEFGV